MSNIVIVISFGKQVSVIGAIFSEMMAVSTGFNKSTFGRIYRLFVKN